MAILVELSNFTRSPCGTYVMCDKSLEPDEMWWNWGLIQSRHSIDDTLQEYTLKNNSQWNTTKSPQKSFETSNPNQIPDECMMDNVPTYPSQDITSLYTLTRTSHHHVRTHYKNRRDFKLLKPLTMVRLSVQGPSENGGFLHHKFVSCHFIPDSRLMVIVPLDQGLNVLMKNRSTAIEKI